MTEKRKEGHRNATLLSRRGFIAGAGAAAISFTVIRAELVRGTAANSKLKLGMIGCGKRGTRVAGLFKDHGGFEIWAGADYFQDRVDGFGEKYQVDPKRLFTTLSCYKRLLESGVDAVAIESPPYFHVEQAAAAAEAGVHVYLAKPIAVDVPGCHTIEESGRKATARRACFLVDFQTRADEFFNEAIRRVHQGDIGDLAFGEASYHCGPTWSHMEKVLGADPTNPETRLRAWGLDRNLSGDIITEQNIHTLDVASWIMDEPPVYAAGTGGRKVRTHRGNCWDHFTSLYQYSNNVGITFSSRQFEGYSTAPQGIRNRMFGSAGVLETQYGGAVLIRGKKPYPGGETRSIYIQGIVKNIATFYNNIADGRFENETVPASVRSNLVTLLGRTAAYRGEKVYWHQLLNSSKRLEPDLRGLKA